MALLLLFYRQMLFRELIEDFLLAREPAHRMLREHELAVGYDVEDAFVSFDQLGFDPELVFQSCCQTGSAR